jgi:hypothetical protein
LECNKENTGTYINCKIFLPTKFRGWNFFHDFPAMKWKYRIFFQNLVKWPRAKFSPR